METTSVATVDGLHSRGRSTKYSHRQSKQANIEPLQTCLMSLLLDLTVCRPATSWQRYVQREKQIVDPQCHSAHLCHVCGIFQETTELFSLGFIQKTSPRHSMPFTNSTACTIDTDVLIYYGISLFRPAV